MRTFLAMLVVVLMLAVPVLATDSGETGDASDNECITQCSESCADATSESQDREAYTECMKECVKGCN